MGAWLVVQKDLSSNVNFFFFPKTIQLTTCNLPLVSVGIQGLSSHSTQKIREQRCIMDGDGYAGNNEGDPFNTHESDCSDVMSTFSPYSEDDGFFTGRKNAGVFSQFCSSTSFNSEALALDYFPPNWHSLIIHASQKWNRQLALVQPFSQSHIQWNKANNFVPKILDTNAPVDYGKKTTTAEILNANVLIQRKSMQSEHL